jgi:Tfp pilus assembly protein PilF
MRCIWSIFLLFCLAGHHFAYATPYHPKTDAEVLEQLPARGKDWLAIRDLRTKATANPNDLNMALKLVRRYIELGRAESDPRYYGYAEALLSPRMQAAHPPAAVLTLRATLFQNRHEFPAALEHLQTALAQQPRLTQAWLTRALILEVQGHYADALNSCLTLSKLAPSLSASVCINSALSLSGQLDNAYQQLSQIVRIAEEEAPQDRQWALICLAEMAERKGEIEQADGYYRKAFDLKLRNGYLLGAYADFLQDQARYQEVITLLKNETRADGLLLRLTRAEQQLNLPDADIHIEILKARFAASKMRGDNTHQGDEARFLLYLLKQPELALALAKLNWAVQREPRDARILLETALAAGNNQTQAQSALDFLIQNKLQDVRLQPLIAQFKGVSS